MLTAWKFTLLAWWPWVRWRRRRNDLLIFDTETTGLPDLRMPPEWEGQPRICQIGAILTDGDGKVKSEINLIIKPDAWKIPDSASQIHGITQDVAEKYGLSAKGVLSVFSRLLLKAERIIAHNIPFDLFMLEIECSRNSIALDLPNCTPVPCGMPQI